MERPAIGESDMAKCEHAGIADKDVKADHHHHSYQRIGDGSRENHVPRNGDERDERGQDHDEDEGGPYRMQDLHGSIADSHP